jgi:hypothetical protein
MSIKKKKKRYKAIWYIYVQGKGGDLYMRAILAKKNYNNNNLYIGAVVNEKKNI